MKKVILLLYASFVLLGGCEAKVDPVVTRRVNDYTNTLSRDEVGKLERKLEAHENLTSNQIAVVIIKSLDGRGLETLSLEIAEKWQGGQKGKDNGLLILIVKNNRKIRIETGYGFEGRLPDGMCGRIIRDEITPHFKDGNFFKGIDNGIDKIFLVVKGEYIGDNTAADQESERWLVIVLVIVAFIVCAIAGSIHRAVGSIFGGIAGFLIFYFLVSPVWGVVALVAGLILGTIANDIASALAESGSSGGSWSSGGSSGGGFSGGGGGFGGGGASGGW